MLCAFPLGTLEAGPYHLEFWTNEAFPHAYELTYAIDAVLPMLLPCQPYRRWSSG